MLFRPADLEGIAAGTITVAFRRWDKPRVKVGSTQKTPVGVIEFTSCEMVESITDEDARAAGFASPDEVEARMRKTGRVYRVGLRVAGPDPRVALGTRRPTRRCSRRGRRSRPWAGLPESWAGHVRATRASGAVAAVPPAGAGCARTSVARRSRRACGSPAPIVRRLREGARADGWLLPVTVTGDRTALRTKGDVQTSPRSERLYITPGQRVSFPRDPQEAGGRAWRPTICQWPVTRRRAASHCDRATRSSDPDVRAARAQTPLPSPSMAVFGRS